MEEVDQIIIHALRQIGCEFDEDVVSLKQFTTEVTVEAVVRCLRLISPEKELPLHISTNMVERYNLGMTLANACIELGFKGDLGYQTFLYSNEAEMRRIFMFLFEKLPKESEKVADQQLGAAALISRSVSEQIARQLKAPWLPSYCKKSGVRWKGGHWWKEDYSDSSTLRTCKLTLPGERPGGLTEPLWKQALDTRMLAASVFEVNTASAAALQDQELELHQAGILSKGSQQEHRQRKKERIQKRVADAFQQSLLSSEQSRVDVSKLLASLSSMSNKPTTSRESKFTRTEKLQFTKDEELRQVPGSQLELQKQSSEEETEAKITQMQSQLESISEVISQLEGQEKEVSAALQLISGEIEKKKSQRLELESQNELEHKALALLPNADENILKLQAKIDAAAQKLVSLSMQWEKHRAPLIEEYRQLKEQCSKRLNETQQKLEEIKAMKDKMREISEQARTKEEMHKQLVAEYEKLPKDVNRSSYTKRITEIVGNIKKQKEEIAKVLLDTRSLQKEINQLTGKLDRTFTVTDELIFKDAKKDEAVRRAYKYLASVHENSNQLLQAVEETGSITREMRDLEDQIEQESQKKVTANLERITADYKQMKQENASLLAQLKGQ
ncbi:hypothetical protein HPB50_009447 [Hyalomma asiaticum]|uniref:Uncharacterized protein n=1 Tax=Hyalomma asiaticum TaxID=266040 RepID=A0ACB7SP85_HYAAI|nr:hypothetical protein HPB50_009447 [Hyalomma asiaticum]